HASQGALQLIERIQAADIVERVIHPALPTDSGHSIWKRDFHGASGVFGVVFKQGLSDRVSPALNVLKTFAIGASWCDETACSAP
ncbi:PLP-dependent transferase, partial [Rhizobium johnstonii]|uniref:PLP-dependent transferase n=1 Tax=Rhizobium johnstonii TaxID=3019933 RepID=UPI003F972BF0